MSILEREFSFVVDYCIKILLLLEAKKVQYLWDINKYNRWICLIDGSLISA
jgi:hypothetical protein